MDWSNRFNFGGFFVTYCTFQIPWEVIEKKVWTHGGLKTKGVPRDHIIKWWVMKMATWLLMFILVDLLLNL